MQQALIFDMDGTMVDNMMTHHHGWQKTLKQYGLDFTLEQVMEHCHGKNIEIIERLFPGKYSREERERISFEKESGYRDIFLPELKLVNGLPELLETARKSGIPMGIGTAAPKANVDFVLDNLNIRSYFQAVVHADDVDKGKPDPGVFFKVADLLHVPYGDCLVFEDSPTGAKTALNAGMKAIILTTTHQSYEFEGIASVMRCVPDYTHLDLLSILETINQQ
ncbi:MAG TPA: HAD family phosphatase [Saprospiraceae bacterium]|nr:HAD family phosphatase [Saprospiraceae bacterium]